MVRGVGIDLFDTARIYEAISGGDNGLPKEIFSAEEISYRESNGDNNKSYACLFAAKEAVMKALPANGSQPGYYWREIEIVNLSGNVMKAVLSKRLIELLSLPENYEISISFSVNSKSALACAVLEY